MGERSTSVDECEYRDIFTTVGNLDKLALKVIDVGLEAIILPYFNREEGMVVLLGFPTRDILSEKCFSYLLKVVEGMGWQRVEPI